MNHTAPVARGAAELDRILPGWEQKIDVGALDLASECRCPLGQLAVDSLAPEATGLSPYDRALNAIQPALDDEDLMAWSEDHGFDLPIEAPYGGPADFVDLTQAWKDLITKRLEAAHERAHLAEPSIPGDASDVSGARQNIKPIERSTKT